MNQSFLSQRIVDPADVREQDGSTLAICVPQLKGGGAERIMVLVANEAVRRGIAVDMVLNQVIGPYLADLSRDVTVVSLGVSRVMQVVPRLATYFRNRKPQATLSTLYRQNFMVSMAHAVTQSSARLVLREANTFSLESSHHGPARSPSQRAKRLIDAALLPRLYAHADCVIAISEGVRDDLIRNAGLSPQLVRAVHNPIDLQMVDMRAAQCSSTTYWPDNHVPTIVSVGRLEPQKDFETLIRAFAKARQERAMRLLILGEGSQRAPLERLVAELGLVDHVRMPGFVDNPFAELARSDAFALASRWEGFGNVFIEALALGLPVVATDCPSGPAEILEGGRYGRLVPVGDVESVAEALVDVLNVPADKRRLRTRAEAFSISAILPKYWRALGLEDGNVN